MVDSFLSIGTTRQIKALLYCSDNSVLNHNSSMTYVKNASGTSRWPKPSTGESSWLEYWEKQTGKKATRCGATDCHSTSELVGGHVQKVLGGNEFTSPLCAKAATIAQTTSGLTPNWSEYPADCKQLLGMQRLKCSVAESDGHRIVRDCRLMFSI